MINDSDEVLAANLEFYRAFAARDGAAMDELWARHVPVTCLHPGWTVLDGRDAVIDSWRSIFANPDAPRITCFDERVFMHGGEVALVLCEEELAGGTLAASNLFVREDGAWRLAHHHAGQIVRRQTERRPRSQLN